MLPWLALAVAIAILARGITPQRDNVLQVPYSEFKSDVRNEQVQRVTVSGQTIHGTLEEARPASEDH